MSHGDVEPVPHRRRARPRGDDRPRGRGGASACARRGRTRVTPRGAAPLRQDEPPSPRPARGGGCGLGDRARRSRGRALAVEHGRSHGAGLRPLAERPGAAHRRRALPLLEGRPLARGGRVHRVDPVESTDRRRERVPSAARPAGEGARAHGLAKPRRVRRVPGPAASRRRGRDAQECHPASGRRCVVRVRGIRSDADGAPLRGSVATAARARRARGARPPSRRRDRDRPRAAVPRAPAARWGTRSTR